MKLFESYIVGSFKDEPGNTTNQLTFILDNGRWYVEQSKMFDLFADKEVDYLTQVYETE